MSPTSRRRPVFEGDTKILFAGPEPGTLIQYFKDEFPSRIPSKENVIPGRGVINNRLSEFLMNGLQRMGVENQFLKRLNMREQLIQETEIIPLEIQVRNMAYGVFAKHFSLLEGGYLPRPLVEYSYCEENEETLLVNEEHLSLFDWVCPHELEDMKAMALKANYFLSGLFFGVGIDLAAVRFRFGRLWDDEDFSLVLADEVSADSCDLVIGETLLYQDRSAEYYQAVANRLNLFSPSFSPSQGSSVFH
ncbi:phosphoribosylaminoimidazolesuccinocarboxamide synthase [Acetobacteraceae bacterium]|nr:phosphoribosylaminoimidazolesuccinocarboxamide synthase [Acetobacteraceae bacterium]